jgi:hypothetical protein
MKDGIKNQDSLLSSIFPLDLLHFLSSTRTEAVGEEIPGIRGKYNILENTMKDGITNQDSLLPSIFYMLVHLL